MALANTMRARAAVYKAALQLAVAHEAVIEAEAKGDLNAMFGAMWKLGWGVLRDLEECRVPE